MKYKFPIINTIEDVLPHLEGYPEFIVAERQGYKVINYMVNKPETFEMIDENDLSGAIRRECRGLIFDEAGDILSRPYHKFFNVSEREETHLVNIDLSLPHNVLEKMDGSMIRPLVINRELHLATKMGITEIAIEAKKILTEQQKTWLMHMCELGITPIFEYVAPSNRIVLHYEEASLVLTAMRSNHNGEYFLYEDLVNFVRPPFDIVKAYGSVEKPIGEYLQDTRSKTHREGDVIRFQDGHMLKVKNDWYVEIHKMKDMIRSDRNIASIILGEKIDDTLSLLDEVDTKRVQDYEKLFWNSYENTLDRINGLIMIAKTVYDASKKRIALELVPNLRYKEDAKFLFSVMDGKNLNFILIDYMKTKLSSVSNYDEMFSWLSENKTISPKDEGISE